MIYVVLRSLYTRDTQVIYRWYTLVFTDFECFWKHFMEVAEGDVKKAAVDT